MSDSETSAFVCAKCQNELPQNSTFCPQCGQVREVVPALKQDVFVSLKYSLSYYFLMLLIVCIYKLTSAFPKDFYGVIAVDVVTSLVALAFAAIAFSSLEPLYSLRNLKFNVVALVIGGAVVAAGFVSFLAHFINVTISDDEFYNMYLFEDTRYPLLFAVISIGVQPAIFEEVAFRGFMFNEIDEITTPQTTVFITSILFGILHLSFIALIWLIPIGLVFAFLRMRYNTLWYGVVGHFFYNSSIVLIEYFGII